MRVRGSDAPVVRHAHSFPRWCHRHTCCARAACRRHSRRNLVSLSDGAASQLCAARCTSPYIAGEVLFVAVFSYHISLATHPAARLQRTRTATVTPPALRHAPHKIALRAAFPAYSRSPARQHAVLLWGSIRPVTMQSYDGTGFGARQMSLV